MTEPRQCDTLVAEPELKGGFPCMMPPLTIQATKPFLSSGTYPSPSLLTISKKPKQGSRLSCTQHLPVPVTCQSRHTEELVRMPSWLPLSSPSRPRVPLTGLGERGGQGASHDSFGIPRGWCAASPCRQGVNESSDMSYWSTYVPRFSQTSGKGQTV